MADSETSQTFSRGLDVLAAIAADPSGRTPSQLANELGLSRTIVYRLVNTLLDHRLVRRTEDGVIIVAPSALAITENVLGSLQRSVRGLLSDLARESEATAHFSVADGDDILAVAVQEPPATTFHVAYRTGARTPRGRGALGDAVRAASLGERGLFESEGQLVPGAYGIVAALPGLDGMPAALGVVTLAGQETDRMRRLVAAAARRLTDEFQA